MRSTVLLIVLILTLATCRGPLPEQAAGGVVQARTDTVAVLEAVWRAAAGMHPRGRVTWLYLPSADSAAFTTSRAIRDDLARRGVPASARLPTGHDTVVYRVRRWTRDAAGVPVLELSSGWTRASANAPGGCTTAGNDETFRVSRTPSGWEAAHSGPVRHGDGYCGSGGRRP